MRSTLQSAGLLAALFSVLLMFAGCGKDSAGNTSCTFDTDCDLGKVCTFENICDTVGCEFCSNDQICYKASPEDPGSCSAPECASNDDCEEGSCRNGVCASGCVSTDDCGDGEVCNLAGECVESDGTCEGDADCPSGQVCKDDSCVDGCSNDDECAEGEYCDSEEKACLEGCRDSMECPSGQVCTDGDCACDADSCPDGKVCLETGNCGDPTSCDQIDCGTQVCDPTTLMCIDACTADSCEPNEVCNMQTGLCEVDNCPGEDPTQCDGNAQRPIWDPIKCFCAECTSDAQCDTAAGEVCNASGNCFACETACDPNTPNTCSGGTPYCIDECCVECVGAADCGDGELCLDGFCGQPPNCQVDPSVCPTGYTCQNGQCQPPNNQTCDPTDPTTCPDGTFCDPASGMCQGAGGGFGCGFCNADCTCPNGLNCNGFLCDGCSNNPLDPNFNSCPANQICLDPLAAICFPTG